MCQLPESFSALPYKTSAFVKLYLIGALYSIRERFWRTKLDYSKFPVPNLGKERPLAIVTGGCGEIGFEVVKKILSIGFRVVVIGKGAEEGIIAIEKLESMFDGPKVEFICVDMSSKKQLQKVTDLIKRKYSKIHLLINNAGTMLTPYEESQDGYELHFAVNYFAHAYLSLALLPLLEKSSEDSDWSPRIVQVTSATLFAGNLRTFIDENLQVPSKLSKRGQRVDSSLKEIRYSSHGAYANSKLAAAAFFTTLQERLKKIGSKITVVSLHPGVVPTPLYRHVWAPYQFLIVKFPGPYILRTKSDAADDVVYHCLSPSSGEGGYFEHSYKADITWMYSSGDCEDMWERTLKLCGVGPKYLS